jgi:hypothetical protein
MLKKAFFPRKTYIRISFPFSKQASYPSHSNRLDSTNLTVPDDLYKPPSDFCIVYKSKADPLQVLEAFRGEKRYSSCLFLTSELDVGEWSASRPGPALLQGKDPPSTHWVGGWGGGSRAWLDAEGRRKIICSYQESNPLRPGLLGTLSYPRPLHEIQST